MTGPTMPADQLDLREERHRNARLRLKRARRDFNKIHAIAKAHPDDAFFRSEEKRMRDYLQLLIDQEGETDAR